MATDRRTPFWHRFAWFVGIWGASAVASIVVVYGLRLLLG